MSQALFVVNAGSSSIKFRLYRQSGQDLTPVFGGALDGIGTRPRLRVKRAGGEVLADRTFSASEIATAHQAQTVIADWVLHHLDGDEIVGVGHRVVHGGPIYSQPVLIDDDVLRTLRTFIPLAPLHQLSNLDPIETIRERRPDLPQVACFDTAFHRGHPEISDRFALPRALYDEGVRRYGFHGLSYEYVSGELRRLAPEIATGNVVIAHLGSGASVCALREGHSIESTLGFTPLDGLPMGTRSGSLDPGVVLHLIEQRSMSAHDVGHMLYHESGLLGLSGISNDVRDLLASDRPEAAMAIEFFCLRVAQAVVSLATTLGGLDALVFTAGIGENAAPIRQRVVQLLEWCGLALGPSVALGSAQRIDGPGSRAAIFVIPTDEEQMIARHTLHLLGQGGTGDA